MKELIVVLPLLMLSLSLQSKARSYPTYTYSATMYNNAASTMVVWPIPIAAPPKVAGSVPPKRKGVVTAPANIGWPTAAKSVIFVGEPLSEEFAQMVNEMGKESQGKPNYDWTGEISRRLAEKPKSEWYIMYSPFSGSDRKATYVIYNDRFSNDLQALSTTGDNTAYVNVLPSYNYQGI